MSQHQAFEQLLHYVEVLLLLLRHIQEQRDQLHLTFLNAIRRIGFLAHERSIRLRIGLDNLHWGVKTSSANRSAQLTYGWKNANRPIDPH